MSNRAATILAIAAVILSLCIYATFAQDRSAPEPADGERITTEELGLLALQARLRVELVGVSKRSLKEKEVGVKLTFFSEIAQEQTISKDDIRLFLLTGDGVQVKDALFGAPDLGKVTLGRQPVTIVKKSELVPSQLTAGEKYYLVCVIRNVAGMATFTAVE